MQKTPKAAPESTQLKYGFFIFQKIPGTPQASSLLFSANGTAPWAPGTRSNGEVKSRGPRKSLIFGESGGLGRPLIKWSCNQPCNPSAEREVRWQEIVSPSPFWNHLKLPEGRLERAQALLERPLGSWNRASSSLERASAQLERPKGSWNRAAGSIRNAR